MTVDRLPPAKVVHRRAVPSSAGFEAIGRTFDDLAREFRGRSDGYVYVRQSDEGTIEFFVVEPDEEGA